MKLGIMQPYFFPYIGYFQAISAVDKYILYGNLTFIKDAWMNRNRLMGKGGNEHLITVPLLHKSSYKWISEILIDNSFDWQGKLLKTITMDYGKAPFFDEIYPVVQTALEQRYNTLMELNASTIKAIAHILEIHTDIDSDNSRYVEMESILAHIEDDYSPMPYLEKTRPIRKVARVIEMCRREKSDFFVNAIGGMELYNTEEFAAYGISLHFVKTNEIWYKQFNNTFVPNLSIIDVLMHNGIKSTQRLLMEYKLTPPVNA
ncbi:MAG: WbqC family protein [Paludibacteraceae bacterium]|nr:WbqC family protein [Paludibacteraceae bacterium]